MKRIILAAVFMAFVGCNCEYSDGSRVGVIRKLSHKGFFCRTWEGEMNLNSYKQKFNDDGQANGLIVEIWNFHVKEDDKENLEAVNSALESGKRVKITYNEVRGKTPCNGDSNYDVVKVEQLE